MYKFWNGPENCDGELWKNVDRKSIMELWRIIEICEIEEIWIVDFWRKTVFEVCWNGPG